MAQNLSGTIILLTSRCPEHQKIFYACSIVYNVQCLLYIEQSPMSIVNCQCQCPLSIEKQFPLYNVQCPLYNVSIVQCKMSSVQCTMPFVKCISPIVQCALYIVHCTLNCTLCNILSNCRTYDARCTIFFVQCSLYTILNILTFKRSCSKWHVNLIFRFSAVSH